MNQNWVPISICNTTAYRTVYSCVCTIYTLKQPTNRHQPISFHLFTVPLRCIVFSCVSYFFFFFFASSPHSHWDSSDPREWNVFTRLHSAASPWIVVRLARNPKLRSFRCVRVVMWLGAFVFYFFSFLLRIHFFFFFSRSHPTNVSLVCMWL